ncbi:MAG TPA: MBL fold metallo-hydrolase [Solirubrobacteraceae bacterium]|nr:MBL fold metallo-hydrolase [Solirubrobacteraceae bacterium]
MRAVSLHRDVIVVTSQLFQAHCTIVRAPGGEEAFAIDSPVLPEELELLASLVQQAGFPEPQGLLATHADWDHVLAPLAFREAALGCAESSVERLRAEPGAAQRALRRFDEELHVERRAPLSLGSVQALAVPGRCSIGDAELELHPTAGHTADGMAICIPWARVLVAGDYLSPIELPVLGEAKAYGVGEADGEAKADGVGEANGEAKANFVGDTLGAYVATLERLRPLVEVAEQIVPGHGPVLDGAAALRVLDEDVAYLQELRERGAEAALPPQRRSQVQRELHAQNIARV